MQRLAFLPLSDKPILSIPLMGGNPGGLSCRRISARKDILSLEKNLIADKLKR